MSRHGFTPCRPSVEDRLTDPPHGLRVRDMSPDSQRRHIVSALRARAGRAAPDDWVHEVNIEAVEL